ncbi:MAG: DNA cytosine methyltransferase [Mycoplasma sp.]|nr:DNA cytosine methyltransferase [Mycoplasma sp.]
MNETKVIRVFEAFAGIGAQRKALENINANYKIVGLSEWYVPAIVSYHAIHDDFNNSKVDRKTNINEIAKYLESKTLSMDSKKPVSKNYWNKKVKKNEEELRIIYSAIKLSEKEGNIFDIHNLVNVDLKNVDLLTYSFPCQDLSQQGIKKGMSKESGTRSGLLWQVEKALLNSKRKDLPKYLLMENVVPLMYKNNAIELKLWLDQLEKLGYKNDIGILNATDFGSSQARRRTFMISTLGKLIKLPIGNKKHKNIKSILNKKVDEKNLMTKLEKYKKTDFKITKSNIKKACLIDYTTFNSENYIYDIYYCGPTLTASGANSRIKVIHDGKIRKLNALETYKYMGFNTSDYKKVDRLNYLNEQKMIYTCGNSISVEVLEEIMKGFF